MTNYIRPALYGLLFLLAIMLINAWEKEHPHKVVPVGEQATQEVTSVRGTSAATLPVVPTPSASAMVAPVSQSQLVKVNTDVLTIAISTLGGNMVQASLPTYPEALNTPSQPYILFNTDPATWYVSESGFKSGNLDTAKLHFSSPRAVYQQTSGGEFAVPLTAQTPEGIKITKTFHFTPGSYLVKVDYQVQNPTGRPWSGAWYAQLTRKNLNQKSQGAFHINPFLGAAYSTADAHYQKLSFKKMNEADLSVNSTQGWVAMLEHYFLSSWVPPQNQAVHFYTSNDGEHYSIGFMDKPIEVNAGQSVQGGSQLYVGPLITQDLKNIAPNLDLTVDYGWLWMVSGAIFWLLKAIHNYIGNWGWSIVLVTVVIKLLFYHLSASSYRSMAAMRDLAPRLKVLQERYADDRQKLSQATMELYRKEKINPLGGCLPMLVQIPVFLALYWVLFESVELRQAPFILWLRDLSAPDPYYVLPILMGISMFIQQKLSPAPADPTQAKIMMLMPVIMTLFFLNFPAGLVLYWVVNNTLSILQQWYIMDRMSKAKGNANYKTKK